jgi:hypothetical protein
MKTQQIDGFCVGIFVGDTQLVSRKLVVDNNREFETYKFIFPCFLAKFKRKIDFETILLKNSYKS